MQRRERRIQGGMEGGARWHQSQEAPDPQPTPVTSSLTTQTGLRAIPTTSTTLVNVMLGDVRTLRPPAIFPPEIE